MGSPEIGASLNATPPDSNFQEFPIVRCEPAEFQPGSVRGGGGVGPFFCGDWALTVKEKTDFFRR